MHQKLNRRVTLRVGDWVRNSLQQLAWCHTVRRIPGAGVEYREQEHHISPKTKG